MHTKELSSLYVYPQWMAVFFSSLSRAYACTPCESNAPRHHQHRNILLHYTIVPKFRPHSQHPTYIIDTSLWQLKQFGFISSFVIFMSFYDLFFKLRAHCMTTNFVFFSGRQPASYFDTYSHAGKHLQCE